MIRLIQRKLIIPRGDTGTFSVPVLSTSNTGDVAVFTIFDTLTRSKVYQKQVEATDSVLTIRFEHEDTVNLPAGKFVWDIKFYQNPVFIDGELVSGNEVDSYYAAYSLPECEIRMTGDNLLTSDEAPTSTVSPMYLNIVNAAINDANAAKRDATTAKNSAEAAAGQAADILDQITGLSAEATSLQPTQSATANYNAETGVLTIGIPKGVGIADAVLNNDYTLTITLDDNTTFTTNSIRGETGVGITSITKTNTSDLIDTYTITYSNNTTTTFTVSNGATPVFSIGTVTEGATAAATITGTTANPVLNLVLPVGSIPTKVSQLQNDSGFITTETDPTVPEWAKAAQKPTYTAAEVGAPTVQEMNAAIANVNTMKIHICAQGEYNAETGVPTIQNPDTQTFYLVPGGEGSNLFIEWAYVNSAWERFGSADVDLSGYATKADTVLDTTLSRGRKEGTTVGEGSFAFGDEIEASNVGSFSHGYMTIASGRTSHAEGQYSIASGNFSHAEGQRAQAIGFNSHAEGSNTIANATDQHVSGTCNVGDNNEGFQAWEPNHEYLIGDIVAVTTIVNNEEIITNYKCKVSHTSPTTFKKGTYWSVYSNMHYAEIVGNGSDVNNRSNAYALDWDGNGHYAGDVYVHANADSSGGTKLATVEDIPEVPVQDVQVNGVSVLSDGVANVPLAGYNTVGVVKVPNTSGLHTNSDGTIATTAASSNAIKSGNNGNQVIVPQNQHIAAFYGLAKAAGDSTQSSSSNAVGTYTEDAKSAISTMLNGAVSVSGSTPSITAKAGIRYVCSEVSTLDITLPASGIVDVVFESGSTPTVMTITPPTGVTLKWANGFDPTALEADTTYEIRVRDGHLASAYEWA